MTETKRKTSVEANPLEVYPTLNLPNNHGSIDVIKGDFQALSDNAQNFIIEHVRSTWLYLC